MVLVCSYGLPQPQYDQYGAYVAPQPLPITPSGYAPVQVILLYYKVIF